MLIGSVLAVGEIIQKEIIQVEGRRHRNWKQTVGQDWAKSIFTVGCII